MPELVLDAFESTVQMSILGALTGSAVPTMTSDATAVFMINIDHMKSVFQFQTDSADIIDASASDLRYYVDLANWPALNVANAMMDHAMSASPIASGYAANKMMVAHDYTRYLAQRLFGTHQGVDLFNNEDALLTNLRLICGTNLWTNGITYTLSRVSTLSNNPATVVVVGGASYTTNSFTTNTNICRVLFQQLVSTVPGRFSALANTSDRQSLPFQEDDVISFKLTINPATGQHLLTSVAPLPSRSYRIKLVMKAPANMANTTVDLAEL